MVSPTATYTVKAEKSVGGNYPAAMPGSEMQFNPYNSRATARAVANFHHELWRLKASAKQNLVHENIVIPL